MKRIQLDHRQRINKCTKKLALYLEKSSDVNFAHVFDALC